MDFGGGDANDQKIMAALRQELSAAYSMQFFETLREKCFQACVGKPGDSLSSSEKQCLSRCIDRYVDATKAVNESLTRANM